MNRSVLVTGSSTGFGLETSLHLAERGFRVYATVRNPDHRADLHRRASKRGVQLEVLELDVTDPLSIQASIDRVVSESGEIFGLVNNAGLVLRGYFEDLLDSEIRELFDVNVFGSMAVTRAALPAMRSARRGRIVIISSVAGRIGAPAGSAYSASRFALEGFAEALHQEVLPFGLNVIIVEPGIIQTERWKADSKRFIGARAGDPESPYHAWFSRAEGLFDQAMKASPTRTPDVARAVRTALSASHPRLRYVVGSRARLILGLRKYLPEELFARLYFGEVMRRITGDSETEPH